MNDLTDRDQRIVAATASGLRQADVAELARCSARHVRRRLSVPDVAAAVATEREARSRILVDELREQSNGAVNRLQRIIREGTDRDAVSAARVVLGEGRQHREQCEVVSRLADLEAAVAAERENT